MEYDTRIVRKKFEDLMENPLAKELWVTDPDHFYDPTYHPYLKLVIDSNDITVVNVDEFEDLYSDEETNYWDGLLKATVNRFDPAKTGVRTLTCVYKDGHWLSFDEQLTVIKQNGVTKIVPRCSLKAPYAF